MVFTTPFLYGDYMIFRFFNNQSDERVINKDLLNPVDFQVDLRQGFNRTNPEIVIQDLNASLEDYNYCLIVELNRYYFIKTVSNVGLDFFKIDMELDVLETFKADILSSNSRYRRQLRTGDYVNIDIESSSVQSVETFESNKGFDGEKSLIMTTVGE